jgi:hypothetical protein
MVHDPHAVTANREIHGFAKPQAEVCQARLSPLHQQDQP